MESVESKERIRLNAGELGLMKYFVASIKSINSCKNNMPHVFERVPNGKEKIEVAVELLHEILNGIMETVTDPQMRQLDIVSKEMGIVIKPTIATGYNPSTVLSQEEKQILVDAARDGKCSTCIADNKECNRCELYGLLTAIQPLIEYKGYMCPYSKG